MSTTIHIGYLFSNTKIWNTCVVAVVNSTNNSNIMHASIKSHLIHQHQISPSSSPIQSNQPRTNEIYIPFLRWIQLAT